MVRILFLETSWFFFFSFGDFCHGSMSIAVFRDIFHHYYYSHFQWPFNKTVKFYVVLLHIILYNAYTYKSLEEYACAQLNSRSSLEWPS